MKALHLSSFDTAGGAARSAYRIHEGLQKVGADSHMLVQFKSGNNQAVEAVEGRIPTRLRSSLDSLILQFHQHPQQMFSLQWFPDAVAAKVAQMNPDIINLHWVCGGFLQIETLAKLNKPLVWTLHDMWAFTGGCHYSEGCDCYTKSCGNCPQLKSNRDRDLSHWVWQRKAKAWKGLDMTIVTPSQWMASCAESSSLFKNFPVKIIPYGLDTQRYKPMDRRIAREILNLPQDKKLILFSAISPNDPRKGFRFLDQALQKLVEAGWQDKVELLILGNSNSNNQLSSGLKSHAVGKLSDEISLALVYAVADVFAAPSTEDNLPNTVLEAIACGTPSVAFKIGGMPDMIEHQRNGYLVQPYETEEFAKGIAWILEDQERHQSLCYYAREKTEKEFPLELQARRYESLYNHILSQSPDGKGGVAGACTNPLAAKLKPNSMVRWAKGRPKLAG
ncbi:glycosyltransferase family 4 protein [Leptolyngbya sp. 7M]|nr:glycosyltransferase family 4 protein [Leptolyngbya sp. 7M]